MGNLIIGEESVKSKRLVATGRVVRGKVIIHVVDDLQKRNICQHCGTDMAVEKEVFAADKHFTGHSCWGGN